jgi:uncharacterized protein YjbI with pentapeptide repeats
VARADIKGDRTGILRVAVVALAVSVALIWPVTDLIAAHDVGLITGIKRAVALQAAREAVRTQLLTLGAGVFAAGALFYTARNFSLSRGTLEETRRTVELSQGALPESRLFGTDFSGMNLRGATFIRADLAYSVFRGTHAEYTSFAYANLAYSVFLDAHLQNAWLVGAILTNAEFLAGTDLTGADLTDANLLDADLNDADLTGAKYPAGALPSGWERNGAGLLERAGTSPPDSR